MVVWTVALLAGSSRWHTRHGVLLGNGNQSGSRSSIDQRDENAYLFGAICPSRDHHAACQHGSDAHTPRRDQPHRAPGAHGLIILDQAGWRTTRKLKLPKNLTMVPLPPACP
jgi:hypothetical protein